MLVRNILNNTDYTTENFSKWTAKILMAVIVVIFNYVMSKLVIFRKKSKEGENNEL
jgi:putative flippase GtrA